MKKYKNNIYIPIDYCLIKSKVTIWSLKDDRVNNLVSED